ncbi:sensor histidine kinase [Tichowtungia aerotolerans]|uniref:Histidine kinase domain-containing protein n=1 Tax=Tichowtungia aerotolerans TaxID=2697043 RepID=A0A6P1MCN2_9BACT|nr:sensor histidine kinase [Tichowtungia aerotolerans]QHI70334.1 hypothetical protein GT409_13075 [Tichowtungia aerotolerans]
MEKISKLPHHNPVQLSDHLGWHSLPVDLDSDGEVSSQVIDVKFDFDVQLDSIALVPVSFPDNSKFGAYAFPKRFKIEVLESGGYWVGDENGQWILPPPPYKWVEMVNWMDEDFPDPGSYPVFFGGNGRPVYQVRITIPQGVGKYRRYHAINELYLFRRQSLGHIGDNMMVWGDTVEVEVSNSLSEPPLWNAEYLYDGVVDLGMPLSEEVSEVDDLMVIWNQNDIMDHSVQITLDLGKARQVGRVQLWPAEAPYGMEVPLFGFPDKVTVELSTNSEFSSPEVITIENPREKVYHNNLLNIVTGAIRGIRYVRLTFSDLGEYKGRRILGLGEIRVSEFDKNWSLNCQVRAAGIPERYQGKLSCLVDGYSRHRRILQESEWIKGLAMRRPLDHRLAVVNRKLSESHEALRQLQFRFSVVGGIVLLMSMIAGGWFLHKKRRKELSRLKMRITRDLHDEVGSSLGGISLMTEELQLVAKQTKISDELEELSLMAREAYSSLKEVIWVTDQDSIRLPALVEKLVERAGRVFREMELSVETPEYCPNTEVSLTFKRHLFMFFREALHNCARHAGATQVWVKIIVDDKFFSISIRDNGCGFDPAEKTDGWGLDSMKKRAEELRGALEIDSTPEEGTSVVLKLPYEGISKDPCRSYQTSN